ncbi:hypothetical protein [uncultured Mesonia sp.]|uniref:hypothetical protein n=1 Tax=uncultured Mesonia sp. TaxID=399731 RepID=UPI00374F0ADA
MQIKSGIQVNIALGLFLMAIFGGLILRLLFFVDLPLVFKHMVHAHSHTAILGWIYLALVLVIYKNHLESHVPNRVFFFIYSSTLVSIVGMMLSFPFQGYAAVSIFFSTLFLFCSYAFYWAFIKYAPKEKQTSSAYKCIRLALLYMVISSLGPWAIGPIMSVLGADSPWYRVAIYFYLHFQYNAWMILALIGGFLFVLEQKQIYIQRANFKKFIIFFHWGVCLSFLISILFLKPNISIYVIALIGGVFQFLALWFLLNFFRKQPLKLLASKSKVNVILIKTVLLFYFIKLLMQLLAAFPLIASYIINFKNLAIGFLHWVFLGVGTPAIFYLLHESNLLKLSLRNYEIYLLGFLLTEILIIWQALVKIFNIPNLPNLYYWLFAASCFIAIAVGGIFISTFKRNRKATS